MKLVNLKCPNCDGKLTKTEDSLQCESCGAVFAIDYDESDVEIERLRMEASKQKNSTAGTDNAGKNSKASRTILLLFVLIVFAVIPLCFAGIMLFQTKLMHGLISSVAEDSEEEEIVVDNYQVTPADVSGMLDEFKESGKNVQMNIEECAYWDGSSSVKFYDKTDAEFQSAYLITDIPNENIRKTNRLVIIYKVTWNNENLGDQICYDAVYFEGLKVNPNGGVISDFDGQTINRSDAAWGWSMAYSYEDLNQCYRENVTALGGKVEELTE
jgi:hypothetical protein